MWGRRRICGSDVAFGNTQTTVQMGHRRGWACFWLFLAVQASRAVADAAVVAARELRVQLPAITR